jgi:hypothetical protein
MKKTESWLTSLYQEEMYNLPARDLVLFNVDWETFTEEHKALFKKILSAVKLSPGNVQVLIKENLEASDIEKFPASRLICFGTTFQTHPKYQVLNLGEKKIIVCDAFADLDDIRKKNLWVALKQMYTL